MRRFRAGGAGTRREAAMNGTERTVVRTACGRDLIIGRLRLKELRPSAERVTLDVGWEPYDCGEVWARYGRA
jgi:hypothetical protein